MIGALASGLLGQIEGMNLPSAAMASVSSFLGDPTQDAAQAPAKPAPGNASAAGGPTATVSDQLQSMLLQIQSGQDAQGAVQADDLGGAVQNIG